MIAAYAQSISDDDPLSGLVVGERPDPEPPAGWTTVEVRAAALNHHDLWSLRGQGLREDQVPMILGCDAAGVDSDGNGVIVHSVISRDDCRGDETLDPKRSLLSEVHAGRAGRARDGAQAQPRAEAGRAVLRGGGVPADGVADRLPDAVRQGAAQPGQHRARAGREAAASPRAPSRSAARPGCACG